MSNARKLQTEIDRVMKKVDEGVELFDEIWEKVYSAEQQNQKEKYEMDLKKEIKKLQRLRDQIKSWIGSSDVKDKEPLLDARRLIETKMEAFKYCEKETKTKTYSKEGLAKADKLTPEEEAKKVTCEWINDIIEKLQEMVEERDLEVERLAAGKGKKTNKNLIDECNHYLAMHRFHLTKLVAIIRLVNNDIVSVDVVDPLKEDLEYYIDSYDDDDYQQAYDEEFFYEALGFQDLHVHNVDRVTQASAEKVKTQKNDPYSDLASSSSKGSEKGSKKSKKSSSTTMIPLTIGRARKGKKASRTTSTSSSKSSSSETSGDEDSTHGNTPTKRRGLGVPTPTTIPAASSVPGGSSMAAILKRESEQEKERAQKALAAEQLRLQQIQQAQQQQAALRAQQQAEQLRLQQQEAQMRLQQAEAAKQKALQEQQAAQAAQIRQQQEAQLRQQQLQAAQQQQQQAAGGNDSSKGGSSSSGAGGSLDIISGLNGMSLGVPTSGGGSTTGSVASRGSHRRGASGGTDGSLSGSNNGNNTPADGSVLDQSYATLPSSNEHDRTTSRTNSYAPQNPYPSTPASYPSTPNTLFENPSIFEKLGTDALFYIFYYKQGTYQQYLAARELKKQSWRFHKKYMTWFQRHEEPKVTTDEYEQGTYVYFDWETGWCTRIKQDFRFEYSFLEDTLQ